MKTLFKSLTWAVALTAALALRAETSLAQIGQEAPAFAATDINGQPVKLSDFRGKTVVLEWTNPECPVVGRHYKTGNIPALQKEATGEGVVWILINSGAKGEQGDFEPDQVKAWLQKNGASATAYLRDRDGSIGKLYGAKTTPHLFIVDKEGKLAYRGGIDNNRRSHEGADNYVKNALTSLRNGTPVEKASTEPYGCAVKY